MKNNNTKTDKVKIFIKENVFLSKQHNVYIKKDFSKEIYKVTQVLNDDMLKNYIEKMLKHVKNK